MSSSDIRDILQIGSPKEPIQKAPKQTTEKRPDGISRELYQLIGGAPPVAFVKPTLKSKIQNKQRVTPWVEQTFSNPARTDGLELKHWVRKSEEEDQEYGFAKFNKKIEIIEYTEEDYERHLTDSDWSKEETDHLFELCRKYDLRFPVIEDRYEKKDKERTMEDLKDRYYTVCRKMILYGKGEEDQQTLAQQYAFDKSKETERKNALIMLFNRTKEQVQEEEALLVEAKRIEMNETRLAKDRESLLNSLQLEQIHQIPSTPNTPLSATHANNFSAGSIGITGGTASNLSLDVKKKRKLQEEMKKGRKLSSAAVNTVEMVEALPEIKREKLTPGVFVRSQKLPIVKPTMQQKAIKILEELGIGPRPIMPTAQVCHKFEHLQNSILNMFELKKLVDKTEMEHKVKIQKGGIGITTNAGRKRSSSNAGAVIGNREKRKK